MNRRLIVMRHAKSSWDSPAGTDHARPLNERGRYDAPRVAKRIAELQWLPQYILSSDSQRTRETCLGLMQSWDDGIELEFLSTLYLAGTQALGDALVGVPDEVETLLVVGHNPGWQQLVYDLAGEAVTMKTATAALLSGTCEFWTDAVQSKWSVQDVIYPRDLR